MYVFIIVGVPIQFRADKRALGENPKTLVGFLASQWLTRDWLQ